MGHRDCGGVNSQRQPLAVGTGKCRVCGSRLEPGEGDDLARSVCLSCAGRPEGRRLGTPAYGPDDSAVGSREFTPAELALIRRMHSLVPPHQLLDILNERLASDLGPDAARYTLKQLQGAIGSDLGKVTPEDWASTRKFLAEANRRGVLQQIDEAVINAFAVVFQLQPKQVIVLKDVILGEKG